MSLNHLKKRISTAKSISKITNAMKLLASGKLQKQKNIYYKIKDYYHEYYSLVGQLISSTPELDFKGEHKLHIIVNSHLGLCGGYNINVIKHALGQINENDKVLQLGKRGKETILKKINSKQFINYEEFNINSFEYIDCLSLTNFILKMIENKEIDGVVIHYTKFVNAITFSPESLSLLPFDQKFKPAQPVNDNVIYEPDKKTIIKQLVPSYLASVIYGALVESTISENASRRNAMDTATDNSNDLINKLQIQYNRARQAKITEEITEIISGSNVKE